MGLQTVWMLMGLLCGTVIKANPVAPGETSTCNLPDLEEAITEIFHFLATSPLLTYGYVPPSEAQQQMTYQWNSESIGYNLSTPEGIHQLACRFANIHTIEDVVEFLPIPEPEPFSRFYYKHLQAVFRRLDGLVGIQKGVDLIIYLLHIPLLTSFPDLPARNLKTGVLATREQVLGAMEQLKSEIGDYLLRFHSVLNLSSSPPLYMTLSPEELADVLTQNTSREDLADGLQLHISFLNTMADHKEYFEDVPDFVYACGRFINEITKLGVMDIEVD